MVSISKGNSKLGSIPSVSLPAGVSCRSDCGCINKCYAQKLERIRPSVREAYRRNWDILHDDPEQYWREVEASIMMSRFFRFHVSGDIPNKEYFAKMVEVSERNPHCEILCFTKRFEIVNNYLNEHGGVTASIPQNLHLVFSGWRGMEMENPHNLPEAHVVFRDGFTTARPDAISCEGNCTECAVSGGGCWSLSGGAQVVFHEH